MQGNLPYSLAGDGTASPLVPASRWQAVPAAGLLVLAAVAAYHNSFAGAFVRDDVDAVVTNHSIRRLWPIWEVLSPPPHGETVSGRPLLNLSLAINYAISGLEVWSYHVANLLIHIAAALLLFGIVRRTLLTPTLRDRFGRAATAIALASALLWAVHPLQTESVAYIAQRAESLMGFFYLLTLYCVIRGASAGAVPFFAAAEATLASSAAGEKGDCPPRHCSWLWYATAVLACLLGMACKEVMATAPLLVLLYDRTFLAGSFAEAWRRRRALYVGLAATWALLAYLVCSIGPIVRLSEMGSRDVFVLRYARWQPAVIMHYLRLSVWPHPLCFDYAWPAGEASWEMVAGMLGLGLFLAWMLWGLVGRKASGFLAAWFLLILTPTSSVFPLAQWVHEHRMYLSLAAVPVFAVAAGYALWDRFVPRPTRLGSWAPVARWTLPALALVAALIALGCTTVVRNRIYGSELTIAQDTVEKWPDSFIAHNTLAVALVAAGRTDEASEHFRQALQLAESAGQFPLAESIRARLELYRTGQPYREDHNPAGQPRR